MGFPAQPFDTTHFFPNAKRNFWFGCLWLGVFVGGGKGLVLLGCDEKFSANDRPRITLLQFAALRIAYCYI